MTKLVYPTAIFLALVLLVPRSVLASTTTDLKVFVANDAVHELQVKATLTSSGDVIPVSKFVISPESVVQVHQNENLLVFTSTNEPQKIEKVKVTDASGITTELISPYSLAGLNVGVYILNVIVNNGSEKTAYETILIILIILAPDQKPVEKTEITKIIQKTKVFVEIDFREEKKCQDGYSYNNKTNECEKINICIAGLKHTDKGCKPLPSPPVEKPQPPMPPTPEPTDRCWDINAGKPMEDCGEEETEQEETANCGGEPCTPDEKEDSWTEPREEEEEESEESNEESQPVFGE